MKVFATVALHLKLDAFNSVRDEFEFTFLYLIGRARARLADKWWWELTESLDPTIEELTAAAENIIEERYEPLFEAYGKPIFLQQLAYASYDGAAGASQISTEAPEVAEGYPYNDEWVLDLQEQVDAYEACFRAISDEETFSGVFAFSYGYWDLHDKSSGFRGKPAEEVWIRWNEILVGE